MNWSCRINWKVARITDTDHLSILKKGRENKLLLLIIVQRMASKSFDLHMIFLMYKYISSGWLFCSRTSIFILQTIVFMQYFLPSGWRIECIFSWCVISGLSAGKGRKLFHFQFGQPCTNWICNNVIHVVDASNSLLWTCYLLYLIFLLITFVTTNIKFCSDEDYQQ